MAAVPPPPPPLSLAIVSLAVTSIAVYQLLFAVILLSLPKRALLARAFSLVPLAAAALAVHHLVIARAGPPQRQAPLVGVLAIHALGLAEYVLLSRVDSAKLSTLARGGKGEASVGERLWQALSLSCNARRLGTEWEAKNVFRRSGTQTRYGFLAHVLPRIALCYVIVDALMLAPPPPPELVSAERQTAWRLWTLTPEDIAFRAVATTLFWFVAYCLIYVIIHVPAAVSVALSMSEPEFWPHLFGPLSELWTIRGFWGSFWHQRLRKTLTAFADAIADHVLYIPRPSTLSTYTRLFLVFAISGVLHHPTDVIQGLPPTETATVAFFLMQPVGIVMEDAVQALTRSWPLPLAVRSVAGYVWVVLFLVCTTPTWTFSVARLGQTPDLLPIPVAGPLVAMIMGK